MTREKRTVVIKALFTPCGSVPLSRSEVLGNKGGKGISEFLYRHIGERVYFIAAAKAAMTTVPKLLTNPCTMRMPRFITDCCTQVSAENEVISFRQ